jgi:hypothetical protein
VASNHHCPLLPDVPAIRLLDCKGNLQPGADAADNWLCSFDRRDWYPAGQVSARLIGNQRDGTPFEGCDLIPK